MNVALPAVVFFLLLVPGFLVRTRFKRVERTAIDFSPFGKMVMESVLLAALLHLVWVWAADRFFDRQFNVRYLLQLVGSSADAQKLATEAVGKEVGSISTYLLTLYAASWAVPSALRLLISYFHLDRSSIWTSAFLRFNDAPWYYLLSGADFQRKKVPELIFVSSLVNVADEPWLFVGVLEDYFLTSDGQLDRIVLSSARRRKLSNGQGTETDEPAAFYAIDGDYFVLRYSESITLNVKYVSLPETAPAAQGAPGQPKTGAAGIGAVGGAAT